MGFKIQITVDEELNDLIKQKAKQMGLSVSSFARLALVSVLPRKNGKALDKAIENLSSNQLEKFTLSEFFHQIDSL